MTNICANYLQVVTKDTLENQVSLGICMARFASHCGVHIPNRAVFNSPYSSVQNDLVALAICP